MLRRSTKETSNVRYISKQKNEKAKRSCGETMFILPETSSK